MMRALFYRGRHHVRTAPRPVDGGLVTVDTIASRITRERFLASPWSSKPGSFSVRIVPDVRSLDPLPALNLASWAQSAMRAKAEGLGGLSL